jgi:hypothetical protein
VTPVRRVFSQFPCRYSAIATHPANILAALLSLICSDLSYYPILGCVGSLNHPVNPCANLAFTIYCRIVVGTLLSRRFQPVYAPSQVSVIHLLLAP